MWTPTTEAEWVANQQGNLSGTIRITFMRKVVKNSC